jgi:hypothetical protein
MSGLTPDGFPKPSGMIISYEAINPEIGKPTATMGMKSVNVNRSKIQPNKSVEKLRLSP